MTAKSDPDKKTAKTFEKSLARLETIVTEMESGELGLEDMIARFEEGRRLTTFCSKKLNEVERKIEKLVKDENGDMVATELDDGSDETEDDTPSPPPKASADDELF